MAGAGSRSKGGNAKPKDFRLYAGGGTVSGSMGVRKPTTQSHLLNTPRGTPERNAMAAWYRQDRANSVAARAATAKATAKTEDRVFNPYTGITIHGEGGPQRQIRIPQARFTAARNAKAKELRAERAGKVLERGGTLQYKPSGAKGKTVNVSRVSLGLQFTDAATGRRVRKSPMMGKSAINLTGQAIGHSGAKVVRAR